MARTYETHTREVTDTRQTSHTCDKCGGTMLQDMYDVAETEISYSVGQSYPDGTNKDGIEFDCCTKCFVEHVAPAMVALGFTPYETNMEY